MKTTNKPAEIYIGERVQLDMLNSARALTGKAIYFKPDNGTQYIQIDIVKHRGKIEVRAIHEPTGLPRNYEKVNISMLTDDMLRIFDLLDSNYE